MVKPYYIYGCPVCYIYGQILLHLWLVDLLHLWLKVITFMVFITFMGDTRRPGRRINVPVRVETKPL